MLRAHLLNSIVVLGSGLNVFISENSLLYVREFEPRHEEKPTRSDTNRAIQPQQKARYLGSRGIAQST